ncbi:MAG: terminase large subunit [Bacteroidales bacterium]|nr:terminase large subunit [Bacteroidales bacterium]
MDYVDKAKRYITKVLDGKIPACRWVKFACLRQKQDLERKKSSKFPYHFDRKRANKPCKFIECLCHVKGPKAGECIHLEDWQCFIITTIFGWVDDNGYRRYSQAYIEVGRGNGKSTFCSGIGLYMLCADGELGADIYSFATTRDQARIVFDDALAMARGNKDLQRYYGLTPLNNSMVIIGTNSKFLPKSADAGTLDGLNTHLGIIDELHAHKTRKVYDVVNSSTSKRSQSLIFTITTAGYILDGICMERRRTVGHVLDGSVVDEALFGIIYTIDEDDDWQSEIALRKANPNWCVSVNPKQIMSELISAKLNTSAQKEYLTKHLDVWVNSDHQWLKMEHYRQCIDSSLKESEFFGEYAIYGLDLASKLDISALIRLHWREIDGVIHYYVFPYFYLPADAVHSSDNSQYEGWAKDEYIQTTDGPITDLNALQEWIAEDVKQYSVLSVAYDPMQATQMSQNLLGDGVPMVELAQNLKNMSEPMKQVQALIYTGRLHIADNPVMHWMASNVVCHTDAKENIYPRKEKVQDKIDGMVALIMAINQAIQLDIEHQYISVNDSSHADWSDFSF